MTLISIIVFCLVFHFQLFSTLPTQQPPIIADSTLSPTLPLLYTSATPTTDDVLTLSLTIDFSALFKLCDNEPSRYPLFPDNSLIISLFDGVYLMDEIGKWWQQEKGDQALIEVNQHLASRKSKPGLRSFENLIHCLLFRCLVVFSFSYEQLSSCCP